MASWECTLLYLTCAHKLVGPGFLLISGIDRELALPTRSMPHIMVDKATQINVPAAHITEGCAVSALSAIEREAGDRKIIDIRPNEPLNCKNLVSVQERGRLVKVRANSNHTFLLGIFSVLYIHRYRTRSHKEKSSPKHHDD